MKNVFTLSSENRTIVARNLTVRTAAIEGDAADSAHVIVRDVPFPYCNCVDSFDFDFHYSLTVTVSRRREVQSSRFVGCSEGNW